MKNLVIIVAALMLSGCHSSKQMLPSTPIIVNNTDSVKTEYIETVRIDTVIVEIPVPKESAKQVVPDSTSHLETSLAESDAWLNPDGTLGHSIKNKEQNLKADVMVPVKDTQTNNSEVSVREMPVPYPKPVYIERNFTKWEKIRLEAFWYLVGVSLISIIYIFRKPILTTLRKILRL